MNNSEWLLKNKQRRRAPIVTCVINKLHLVGATQRGTPSTLVRRPQTPWWARWSKRTRLLRRDRLARDDPRSNIGAACAGHDRGITAGAARCGLLRVLRLTANYNRVARSARLPYAQIVFAKTSHWIEFDTGERRPAVVQDTVNDNKYYVTAMYYFSRCP